MERFDMGQIIRGGSEKSIRQTVRMDWEGVIDKNKKNVSMCICLQEGTKMRSVFMFVSTHVCSTYFDCFLWN